MKKGDNIVIYSTAAIHCVTNSRALYAFPTAFTIDIFHNQRRFIRAAGVYKLGIIRVARKSQARSPFVYEDSGQKPLSFSNTLYMIGSHLLAMPPENSDCISRQLAIKEQCAQCLSYFPVSELLCTRYADTGCWRSVHKMLVVCHDDTQINDLALSPTTNAPLKNFVGNALRLPAALTKVR